MRVHREGEGEAVELLVNEDIRPLESYPNCVGGVDSYSLNSSASLPSSVIWASKLRWGLLVPHAAAGSSLKVLAGRMSSPMARSSFITALMAGYSAALMAGRSAALMSGI